MCCGAGRCTLANQGMPEGGGIVEVDRREGAAGCDMLLRQSLQLPCRAICSHLIHKIGPRTGVCKRWGGSVEAQINRHALQHDTP